MAWTPGETLVARRVFDPAEDVYLRDHALGRAISTTDPALSALMVMPLAMSLEILAEAAAFLVPGCPVIGLRDVRAHRWLAWDDEPQTLEVTADVCRARGRSERVHVKLSELAEAAENGEAPKTPAVEAIVVLADAYPDAAGGRRGDLRRRAAVAVDARRASTRSEMFHGPCWQGVRAIAQTGAGRHDRRGWRCCRSRTSSAAPRARASCSTRSCSTRRAR